jgi:hypothetical protein
MSMETMVDEELWRRARGMSVMDEIETGHDLAETMERNRRRQAEAAQSQGLSELAAMLLPLSVALARLTARFDVAGGLS